LVVDPTAIAAEHLKHERALVRPEGDPGVMTADRLERAKIDVDALRGQRRWWRRRWSC
jgi:hypothetical protein